MINIINTNNDIRGMKGTDRGHWDECVRFHGHACPGLAVGYRAAETALRELCGSAARSEDEEIVCVAENESCAVDAVQCMTSCTAGKGNMIFRPSGKMAFSFFLRNTEKGIRVVAKPFDRGDREETVMRVLSMPQSELFDIKEPHYAMPGKARMFDSAECSKCGEYSREDKMRLSGGMMLCQDCFDSYDRG